MALVAACLEGCSSQQAAITASEPMLCSRFFDSSQRSGTDDSGANEEIIPAETPLLGDGDDLFIECPRGYFLPVAEFSGLCSLLRCGKLSDRPLRLALFFLRQRLELDARCWYSASRPHDQRPGRTNLDGPRHNRI